MTLTDQLTELLYSRFEEAIEQTNLGVLGTRGLARVAAEAVAEVFTETGGSICSYYGVSPHDGKGVGACPYNHIPVYALNLPKGGD